MKDARHTVLSPHPARAGWPTRDRTTSIARPACHPTERTTPVPHRTHVDDLRRERSACCTRSARAVVTLVITRPSGSKVEKIFRMASENAFKGPRV
jgi:hypothetical protein